MSGPVTAQDLYEYICHLHEELSALARDLRAEPLGDLLHDACIQRLDGLLDNLVV